MQKKITQDKKIDFEQIQKAKTAEFEQIQNTEKNDFEQIQKAKKDEFRALQKAVLKAHVACKFTRNFAVFLKIQKIIAEKKAKKILLFLPLPYEVDLARFRAKFAKKCKIFVPFLQENKIKMVKLRCPFFKRKFGIYEPNDSHFTPKIDLAVVPVLGVDEDLKRIGHGFGFYDKFFETLSYQPLLVFVSARRALFRGNLGQKHDIRADFYINPYENFCRKELKNARSNNRSHRRDHRRWGRIYSR